MKYRLNDSRIFELENESGAINDFPAFIEVQTSSYCNSHCIVCPYTKIKSHAPMGKMERKLWDKLVNEFEMNRSNIRNVEPYLNNEPFLDKDLMRLLYTLKPIDCYIEVSTNLHNCTKESIDEIIENRLIDEIRCSIFGMNANTYKRIMGINMNDVLEKLKYLAFTNKNAKFPLKVQLTMVNHDSLISNEELCQAENLAAELEISFKAYPYLDRAENNDLVTTKMMSNNKNRVIGCKLGYLKNRLAIWHDGIVALCCQDWMRKHIIGDLNKTTIQDLWKSSEMELYRSNIYLNRSGVSDLLCRKCALSIVEVI